MYVDCILEYSISIGIYDGNVCYVCTVWYRIIYSFPSYYHFQPNQGNIEQYIYDSKAYQLKTSLRQLCTIQHTSKVPKSFLTNGNTYILRVHYPSYPG